MKRLLLIGGTSWHSTVDYYRLINEKVQKRLGGVASSDLYLHSVNFEPFHQYQVQGNWQAIADAYVEDVKALASKNIKGVVICANTMHKVADEVVSRTGIPVLHIAQGIKQNAAAKIGKEQLTLGVLGTEFTMEMPFYSDALAKQNVKMLVPDESARKEVNRVIFDELVSGTINESSRAFYLQQIEALAARGADAVVLGCTEIGMLIDQSMTDVMLIDSLQAHVDYIVNWQLGWSDN